MPDWRKPQGKLELIKEKWGEEVPDYQWFMIKGIRGGLTDQEMLRIKELFFPDKTIGFGDVERHGSNIVKEYVLRIRSATRLHLEFELRGQMRPLYLVGYGDDIRRRIDFYRLWHREPPTLRQKISAFFSRQ
jgi:hypothetical protein